MTYPHYGAGLMTQQYGQYGQGQGYGSSPYAGYGGMNLGAMPGMSMGGMGGGMPSYGGGGYYGGAGMAGISAGYGGMRMAGAGFNLKTEGAKALDALRQNWQNLTSKVAPYPSTLPDAYGRIMEEINRPVESHWPF